MKYCSTRNTTISMDAAQAIKQGLSRDGGLLTPTEFPKLSKDDLSAFIPMTYQQRAAAVLGLYLTDYSAEELRNFAEKAYGAARFDTRAVAPVKTLDDKTHSLELWHGPTSAFKDLALQMLPQLLSAALKKTDEKRTACILAATSGDTGKAAMEGFADVDQTKIMVFYPKDGVSAVQEAQMVTQRGENVGVCAVVGNFDDAQSGVKQIFSDEALRTELDQRGYLLSSANSINWGRILPQVVYYISAYCDLVRDNRITVGENLNFCVPTGNFGDILAGYYAKKMGLPVGKLICASNKNNVLTEFLTTGTYDRNRTFYNTISPSMDILISSNLERLLFDLSGRDGEKVKGYMDQLNMSGSYRVDDSILAQVKECFWAGSCDEETTGATIKKYYDSGYLMDPHTAVAANVMEQYRDVSGDQTATVFVSTASPFKFCDSVLEAIGERAAGTGDDLIDQLQYATGCPAPWRLAALREKQRRFKETRQKEEMTDVIRTFLK